MSRLFIDSLAVFPGGFLPTINFLIDTMTKGSSGALIVESISNIGPHYARTLREWRRRFEAKFDEVIVPALRSEYPDVMGPQTGEKGWQEIEVFRRKWICAYQSPLSQSPRSRADRIRIPDCFLECHEYRLLVCVSFRPRSATPLTAASFSCYCEVGFTTRSLGDHIMTFTREGNGSFGCDVYE